MEKAIEQRLSETAELTSMVGASAPPRIGVQVDGTLCRVMVNMPDATRAAARLRVQQIRLALASAAFKADGGAVRCRFIGGVYTGGTGSATPRGAIATFRVEPINEEPGTPERKRTGKSATAAVRKNPAGSEKGEGGEG